MWMGDSASHGDAYSLNCEMPDQRNVLASWHVSSAFCIWYCTLVVLFHISHSAKSRQELACLLI